MSPLVTTMSGWYGTGQDYDSHLKNAPEIGKDSVRFYFEVISAHRDQTKILGMVRKCNLLYLPEWETFKYQFLRHLTNLSIFEDNDIEPITLMVVFGSLMFLRQQFNYTSPL